MRIQIRRFKNLPKSVQGLYMNDQKHLFIYMKVNDHCTSTCPLTLRNVLGLIRFGYDWQSLKGSGLTSPLPFRNYLRGD